MLLFLFVAVLILLILLIATECCSKEKINNIMFGGKKKSKKKKKKKKAKRKKKGKSKGSSSAVSIFVPSNNNGNNGKYAHKDEDYNMIIFSAYHGIGQLTDKEQIIKYIEDHVTSTDSDFKYLYSHRDEFIERAQKMSIEDINKIIKTKSHNSSNGDGDGSSYGYNNDDNDQQRAQLQRKLKQQRDRELKQQRDRELEQQLEKDRQEQRELKKKQQRELEQQQIALKLREIDDGIQKTWAQAAERKLVIDQLTVIDQLAKDPIEGIGIHNIGKEESKKIENTEAYNLAYEELKKNLFDFFTNLAHLKQIWDYLYLKIGTINYLHDIHNTTFGSYYEIVNGEFYQYEDYNDRISYKTYPEYLEYDGKGGINTEFSNGIKQPPNRSKYVPFIGFWIYILKLEITRDAYYKNNPFIKPEKVKFKEFNPNYTPSDWNACSTQFLHGVINYIITMFEEGNYEKKVEKLKEELKKKLKEKEKEWVKYKGNNVYPSLPSTEPDGLTRGAEEEDRNKAILPRLLNDKNKENIIISVESIHFRDGINLEKLFYVYWLDFETYTNPTEEECILYNLIYYYFLLKYMFRDFLDFKEKKK